MFGFNKKRGSLYKEYRKLNPDKIVKRLNLNNLSSREVIFTMYQFGIYGGLNLQNTLYEKRILSSADQNEVFVHGVAYTWSRLYWAVTLDLELGVLTDGYLLQGLEHGEGVLAEILTKRSNLHLNKKFANAYMKTLGNKPKLDRLLAQNLLAIERTGSVDPIKDKISTELAIQIHSATMNEALVESAKRIIRCYMGLAIV